MPSPNTAAVWFKVVGVVALATTGSCTSDGEREPGVCDAHPGTASESEFLDLRVRFSEPRVAGMRVSLMTYDVSDFDRVYAVADVRVAADGTLDHSWSDAYERYEYQPIAYYVDVDDDGRCTPDVDLGDRFISSAWNPVGDEPLDTDLGVFPLPVVTAQVCSNVERCF
jgi:hypothetical protein